MRMIDDCLQHQPPIPWTLRQPVTRCYQAPVKSPFMSAVGVIIYETCYAVNELNIISHLRLMGTRFIN